ncbi:hypothetical protein NPIL_312371 [Nephila pilipes]|uniref:Uncharacterized protein n=1 Tax=Nephila pilipes TaxID=299642 RepID=A0A8X6TMS6_NEPPI|nr:hypothetical protein NPIL_312371 [Nephila pilipes]
MDLHKLVRHSPELESLPNIDLIFLQSIRVHLDDQKCSRRIGNESFCNIIWHPFGLCGKIYCLLTCER